MRLCAYYDSKDQMSKEAATDAPMHFFEEALLIIRPKHFFGTL
jgi:hypothetical protein